MSRNGIGTRDYNEFVEYFRKESTENILDSVRCDVYIIAASFGKKLIEGHLCWIVVWNSYITIKAGVDILEERDIHNYPTELAAKAIIARLQNELDKRRAVGRDTRLARKLLKVQSKYH